MEQSINNTISTIRACFWMTLLYLNLIFTVSLLAKLRQAQQTIAHLTTTVAKIDDLAKHSLKVELENKQLRIERDACKAVLRNFPLKNLEKWVKP